MVELSDDDWPVLFGVIAQRFPAGLIVFGNSAHSVTRRAARTAESRNICRLIEVRMTYFTLHELLRNP